MIEFKRIELSDRERIEPYLKKGNVIASERNFACLYMWNCHYETDIAVQNNFFFMRQVEGEDDGTMYYPPIGDGDIKWAIEQLENECKDEKLVIYGLTPEQVEEYKQLFPGKFDYTEYRENFDYIYLAENLVELKGKAYHGKRNHINKFLSSYAGRWEYRDIDPKKDCKLLSDFQKKWCLEKDSDKQDDYQTEYCAILRALDCFEELSMCGGVLFVDDKVAAFTIAAAMDDETVEILIEKADSEIEGAYTAINNFFAKAHCVGYKYINREEDLGIEGLRAAKLSYKPAFLSEKYIATVI